MTYADPSSPPDFEPSGLILNLKLGTLYHAVQEHYSMRKGGDIDPLEFEVTALLEDLYNHQLFSGVELSNHSQQPPNKESLTRCDLLTRYWDGDHLRAFLFTEAKRESLNDHAKAEAQLYGYCNGYLKTQKSAEVIFGGLACGVSLRYFILTKTNRRKLVPLCDYIDVADNVGCNTIRYLVRAMKEWVALPAHRRTEDSAWRLLGGEPARTPPQSISGGSPPRRGLRSSPPQDSFRSSPPHGQNLDPRDAQTRSREPSPGYDSRRRSPSASPAPSTPGRGSSPGYDSRRRSPSASPATHTLAMHGSSPAAPRPSPGYDARGYSPAGRYQQGQSSLAPPNAIAGSSRQHSPALSGRPSSRSPPDRSASPMPARQRDPTPVRVNKNTAYEADVAVRRWGRTFEDTQFLVRSSYRAFHEFTVLGSDWRTAEVGQSSRRCFVINSPELGYVYTRYIDPAAIRPVPNTNTDEPSWVARGGWWQEH